LTTFLAGLALKIVSSLVNGLIRESMPMLDAWVARRKTTRPEPDQGGTFVTGIEDRYHDLLVGPCDAEQVATEADCPLVVETSISTKDAFDCTYEEWAACLREEVRKVARAGTSLAPPAETMDEPGDLNDRLHRARTTGLDDGTRIEARGDGWVVIDSFYSFLLDPEDASWVASEDDVDLRPAVFPTPQAAYRAWQRAQAVGEARAERRREAMRRLGKW